MKGFKKTYGVLTGLGMVVLALTTGIPQDSSAVTTAEELKNWPAPM